METSQDDARVWIPNPLMQVAYHSRGTGGKSSNDEPEIGREVHYRGTDVSVAGGKSGKCRRPCRRFDAGVTGVTTIRQSIWNAKSRVFSFEKEVSCASGRGGQRLRAGPRRPTRTP